MARVARWVRQIDAICASNPSIGSPAWSRRTTISGYCAATAASKGKTWSSNAVRGCSACALGRSCWLPRGYSTTAAPPATGTTRACWRPGSPSRARTRPALHRGQPHRHQCGHRRRYRRLPAHRAPRARGSGGQRHRPADGRAASSRRRQAQYVETSVPRRRWRVRRRPPRSPAAAVLPGRCPLRGWAGRRRRRRCGLGLHRVTLDRPRGLNRLCWCIPPLRRCPGNRPRLSPAAFPPTSHATASPMPRAQ